MRIVEPSSNPRSVIFFNDEGNAEMIGSGMHKFIIGGRGRQIINPGILDPSIDLCVVYDDRLHKFTTVSSDGIRFPRFMRADWPETEPSDVANNSDLHGGARIWLVGGEGEDDFHFHGHIPNGKDEGRVLIDRGDGDRIFLNNSDDRRHENGLDFHSFEPLRFIENGDKKFVVLRAFDVEAFDFNRVIDFVPGDNVGGQTVKVIVSSDGRGDHEDFKVRYFGEGWKDDVEAELQRLSDPGPDQLIF